MEIDASTLDLETKPTPASNLEFKAEGWEEFDDISDTTEEFADPPIQTVPFEAESIGPDDDEPADEPDGVADTAEETEQETTEDEIMAETDGMAETEPADELAVFAPVNIDTLQRAHEAVERAEAVYVHAERITMLACGDLARANNRLQEAVAEICGQPGECDGCDPDPDDGWDMVTVEAMGIPQGMCDSLRTIGVTNYAELIQAQAKPNWWKKAPGIAKGKAAIIDACVSRFLERQSNE